MLDESAASIEMFQRSVRNQESSFRIEPGLEGLGRKIDPKLLARIVNMVFGPETEPHLQKGQARIVIVAQGEALKKFQDEGLQGGVRPVREVGFLSFAERPGFVVAGQALDVGGDCRCLAGIGVVEAQDRLVAVGGGAVEKVFHTGPVPAFRGGIGRHLVIADISEFQLDQVAVAEPVVTPENDPGHGLNAADRRAQGNVAVDRLRVGVLAIVAYAFRADAQKK